jgi:uncharacterized protein YndB with AHSA1/START domain
MEMEMEMETMTERVIEKTLEFSVSRERVWQAITDPRELAQWFGHAAEIDLRPGGDGALTWDEHGRSASKRSTRLAVSCGAGFMSLT